MKPVLVVAPHPDDETLGCGGTLARLAASGRKVHWLIVTSMETAAYPAARIAARREEIRRIARFYRFAGVHALGLPTAALDARPIGALIEGLSRVLAKVRPETLLLPHPSDAHSDHGIVFRAALAAAKTFRQPSVKEILCYETVSETDFSCAPAASPFRPTLYSDITGHLRRKLAAFALYAGEEGRHPFPRSARHIEALAVHRGAAAGVEHAEAFEVVKIVR